MGKKLKWGLGIFVAFFLLVMISGLMVGPSTTTPNNTTLNTVNLTFKGIDMTMPDLKYNITENNTLRDANNLVEVQVLPSEEFFSSNYGLNENPEEVGEAIFISNLSSNFHAVKTPSNNTTHIWGFSGDNQRFVYISARNMPEYDKTSEEIACEIANSVKFTGGTETKLPKQ